MRGKVAPKRARWAGPCRSRAGPGIDQGKLHQAFAAGGLLATRPRDTEFSRVQDLDLDLDLMANSLSRFAFLLHTLIDPAASPHLMRQCHGWAILSRTLG